MVSLDEPEFDIVARTNPTGKLIVHGRMEISDGTSNTIVIAENRGSSATCASVVDGELELTGLTIGFRQARSSERMIADIILVDENISESGEYRAVLTFRDRAIEPVDVTLVVEFEIHLGRGAVGASESITVGGNRSERSR